MNVLVTGATGFVGGRLVPALLDQGHDVRVLVRDASRYDAPAGVSVFEGDVLESDNLTEALEGVTCAYYLIHSMRAGGDFEKRDRTAARSFANAATEVGVDRLVYLGGLGEEGEDLSAHLKSRREVEAVLSESGADLVTLRAAIIIGAGSVSFEMVRQLSARLPVMITPKWVNTECQPIAIEDVISYLVGALDVPPGTYEIGGPEVLTYGEMLRRTARVAGRRQPLIVPVPVLTPRLSSYWIGFVTDVDTHVARPLIDGLKNAVVVTDDSIDEYVTVPGITFDEAVERALEESGPPSSHASDGGTNES